MTFCMIHRPWENPGRVKYNLGRGHFPGTKLLKITTKWPPGQIEPQKCIFEQSRAIEIDREKKVMKINFWAPGKNAPLWSLGEGITACHQAPKNCQVRFLVKCSTVVPGGSHQWIRHWLTQLWGTCFFHFTILSCSTSPPNGFRARSSPKNAFLNKAALLKLIGKKGYENQFLGAC